MFDIIIDTREQKPLSFFHEDVGECIRGTIKTGDYTIVGLEDKLTIERKGAILEFYKNITEKRFWNEMERMSAYKYKFLLLEFSLANIMSFPYGCGLSKENMKKLKITYKFLLKCIYRIQVEYGVHVVFGEDRETATQLITDIMRMIHEYETKN